VITASLPALSTAPDRVFKRVHRAGRAFIPRLR